MKQNFVLIAILLSCIALPSASQPINQGYTRHAAYLEVGGQGILYSLNYDYRFAEFFAARVGFSHWTWPGFIFSNIEITAIPIMGEFFIGGKEHFLELGLGVMPTWGSSTFRVLSASTKTNLVGTATLGYRYQPAEEGMLFRASVPFFFTEKGTGAWGGVTVGYAF